MLPNFYENIRTQTGLSTSADRVQNAKQVENKMHLCKRGKKKKKPDKELFQS